MNSSTVFLERKSIRHRSDVFEEFQLAKKCVYSLDRGRAIQFILLTLETLEHYIIIRCHPIVADGESYRVLMADLEKAYDGQDLPPVYQYSKFGQSQREQARGDKWAKELKFWREEFLVIPSPLPLIPSAKAQTRQPLNSYAIHSVDYKIDSTVSSRLRSLCRHNQVTPFHSHPTVFRAFLAHVTGLSDLCIGIAEANRPEERLLGVSAIGPYVNILPLRFSSRSQQSFVSTLEDTSRKVYSALENAIVPLEVLLDEVRAPRSASYSPLFQCFRVSVEFLVASTRLVI